MLRESGPPVVWRKSRLASAKPLATKTSGILLLRAGGPGAAVNPHEQCGVTHACGEIYVQPKRLAVDGGVDDVPRRFLSRLARACALPEDEPKTIVIAIMKTSAAVFTTRPPVTSWCGIVRSTHPFDRRLALSSTLLRLAVVPSSSRSPGPRWPPTCSTCAPAKWEFTQTMTASGAPIYIDAFTPAQRAEYAKSWAKDAGKPNTSHDKQCILGEGDQGKATLFGDLEDKDKECKEISGKATSTSWAAVVECKDAKTTTRTQVDYTAPSPDRLNGILKSTTTSPNGTTVLDFKFNGKWIGAACEDDDEASDSRFGRKRRRLRELAAQRNFPKGLQLYSSRLLSRSSRIRYRVTAAETPRTFSRPSSRCNDADFCSTEQRFFPPPPPSPASPSVITLQRRLPSRQASHVWAKPSHSITRS